MLTINKGAKTYEPSVETIIGYKFKNPELLEIALTHTSYANESRTPVKHNERLEFLGDSVLQIVSADYLFHAYADRPEGDLTRIRASLVSRVHCSSSRRRIDLGEYLRPWPRRGALRRTHPPQRCVRCV